jgi:probable F420-dependent oxidoreductase
VIVAHDRRFRFGLQAHLVHSGPEWRDLARKVEDLGYASLTIHDHIGDQLAPLLALTVAAEVTDDLRIGTLVLDNDFRHPCVLANEVATLDVLSGGRFEWGMGAGWFPRDYERSGIPFDDAGVRISRLQEAIEVMKGLFGDEAVEFDGGSYQVHGVEGVPKPVQRPHPPLLIGSQGRRLLRYAARHADIIGIGPSISTQPLFGQPPRQTVVEALDEQIGWIRDAAGERFDDLEINMVALPAAVVADGEATLTKMAERAGRDPKQVADSPHVILGSVEQICERLEERRERWGVSYYVVPPNALDNFAPVVARLAGR